MNSLPFLLAQSLNPLDPTAAVGKTGGMLLWDILLIVGVILALSLALLIWAKQHVKGAGRSRRRVRRHRHRSHSVDRVRSAEGGEATGGQDEEGDEAVSRPQHRHHRRRRHRSSHRGSNPTLAQTGGLPPRRSDPATPPSA